MELFDFTTLLKELTDYYERAKEPRHGTTELWFNKVKNIPRGPLKWITKKIEDDHDTFPRNLPGAVWAAYREWQQANPDMIAAQRFFDCPDCTEGLIWARQVNNGRRYTYVFRCAKCRQSTTQAYPMALRVELQADFDVIPKQGDLSGTAVQFRDVKEMVDGIGASHV